MTTKKLIIEVRMNEYAGRSVNPNVPWSAGELAQDCAEVEQAGAAIVHFHARQPNGDPDFSADGYGRAITAIRARSSVLLSPTLGQIHVQGDAERLRHIVELARNPETRPDLVPIDTGSSNIDRYDAGRNDFDTRNKVYINRTETTEAFIAQVRQLGMREHICAWTIPFARTAEALYRMGRLSDPLWMMFTLCEGGILGGHPGTEAGLRAFLDNLDPAIPTEWSACCKEGDLLSLVPFVVKQGGHVSIGIGDYAYPELGTPGNADVVRRVVEIARALGREPASPDEARAMLKMHLPSQTTSKSPTAA